MQRTETEINAISDMYFNLMKACYTKCTTIYARTGRVHAGKVAFNEKEKSSDER